MVNLTCVREQNRHKKQRERAKLAKDSRKWKAYQKKQREWSRTTRANAKCRLDTLLEAATNQAGKIMRKRVIETQAAHTKLLNVQADIHAQELKEYSKCVVMEGAKARAAVAMESRKLSVGLEKQMLAYNNRLREQTRMYEKEKIALEKRHMNKQNQSSQWETWWSRLTLEYRRSIIRRMRFKWCGLSFWDLGGLRARS